MARENVAMPGLPGRRSNPDTARLFEDFVHRSRRAVPAMFSFFALSFCAVPTQFALFCHAAAFGGYE
jgi:hypothetical protein